VQFQRRCGRRTPATWRFASPRPRRYRLLLPAPVRYDGVMRDFSQSSPTRLGREVFRLGLSGSYRPGSDVVRKALDAGVNYLFCYGFDTHMTRVIREMTSAQRERCVISTGAYNLIWTHQNLQRTLEKRLRQLRTDYIDVFLFLGVMKPEQFPPSLQEQLRKLKEDGRVRLAGMSCHDRRFAGELARQRALDLLMIRYNAAHPGAEQDIFPYVGEDGPAVVSYTATRWKRLLRRPKGWPKDGPVPTPAQCYRFVLSHPKVDVCLTAPAKLSELEENLRAAEQGPLDEDEMRFLRQFGAAVHDSAGWFM